MAHYQHNTTVAGSLSPALSFISDVAISFVAAVNAVVNRYQAGRAFSGLDGRMLADIGLTQGDVESAFAEPIWVDPTRRLAVIAIERRSAARHLRQLEREKHRAQIAELVN